RPVLLCAPRDSAETGGAAPPKVKHHIVVMQDWKGDAMLRRLPHALATATITLWLAPSLALAAGVHVPVDLSTPARGPLPSNHFSVADATHNPGIRVNLPKPNCVARPSDCADIDVINTLDGFNTQPRLSIPFNGPINVATVSSTSLFLVRLGDALPGGAAGG